METADSTPLVSVIIPIYNAAEFLRETLDSVCAQTLREIEIICVDDGSTDDTSAILAEYAARDPRFVLLRQHNKFAGAARNHGMSVARGKYISFLDSDDLFAPEMFERMVGAAEKWEADIVHCQAREYYPETGKTKAMDYLLAPKLLEQPIGPRCLRHELGDHIFQHLSPATWNKIYLASFLKSHKLDWPNTLYGEDMGFALFAIYLSERSVLLPEAFVRYRIRPDSLGHQKHRDVSIYFQALQIFRERLADIHAEPAAIQSLDNRMWSSFFYWFIPTSSLDSLENLRIAYPKYDAIHFHVLERPADYFYDKVVYKEMRSFFCPAISFVLTNIPAWCAKRKLESLSGMPFYDYEILYAANPEDSELMQELESQASENLRLRIVQSPPGSNAEAACRHAARGRILMHLPGNLKLRTGIAPALRQLTKSTAQGDVAPAPYCTRQSRRELFYRSRSDRRSWCLFGKPVFTVFLTHNGEHHYFLLGKRIGRFQ